MNIIIAILIAALSLSNSNAAFSNNGNFTFDYTSVYKKSVSAPNQDITQFSLVKIQLSDLEEERDNLIKYPAEQFFINITINCNSFFVDVVDQEVYKTYNYQVIELLYPFHYFW